MNVELLKIWDNTDNSNQEMLIQQIGRTCYKKCDLPQTDEGASRFIKKYIVEQKHTSLLEHIWVTFKFFLDDIEFILYHATNILRQHLNVYYKNHISANYLTWLRFINEFNIPNSSIISNTLQALIPSIAYSNNTADDFDCSHPNYVTKECRAYIFKVTGCSRGFTHELVRHRENIVFSQQSTRYVNEKDFTFIPPPGDHTKYPNTLQALYDTMLQRGMRPGEARQYLPIGIESPIVFTCNYEELKYILALRYEGKAGKPGWEMKRIMTKVKEIANDVL